ncbi:DNA primase [Corynebacterium mendelii]|uniref:DNA primase n=1 Tax=Corynebacterium mendelii TaxID=2765362 RepID=A0A939E1V1_9CORY|nr:DNA primase [Corynebacterium mendelii]MBN9644253.1 DNA primase [Corynebacterium mendelii]
MGKGRIPEQDIAAIREQTPIEDVVGEYVQLKPAGADSLKGLSPFKSEKTPSFHVRPQRGYYHCFSTGQGGDVFKFLMEVEHLTFPEAVEYCADKIGYRINYEGGGTGRREEPGTRKRLMEAGKAAHAFYRKQLETPEAGPARHFLTDRGFSQDDAYTFECGYAPGGWDTLTKHLLRKGFSVQELEAAGLVSMGRKGPIDRFHRRLLWPIKSVTGDVIGFGARKLFDDDRLGKYMNTPETMLYKKSKVLFGLDVAKKHIAASHRAVIVEGYTDVMAMHAAGVPEAVAACGTAFGDEHLQMLRRLMLDDSFFRGEIIYTFDGDEAGQKAAMRAFEGNQNFTGQSYVSVAPDGLDPCDLRLQRGNEAVRDLVARRVPILEFVVRSLISSFDLGHPDGRLTALKRVVPVLGQVRDETLRNQYARLLCGWIGWPDESEVLRLVSRAAQTPQKTRRQPVKRSPIGETTPGQPHNALPMPDRKNPRLLPEREAIKLALQYPSLVGVSFDELADDHFTDPAYRALHKAIAAAGGAAQATPGAGYIDDVAAGIGDLIGKTLVSELTVEQIHCPEHTLQAYASSIIARLEEAHVGNLIALKKGQLQRMRPDDDPAAYEALFATIISLEQKRRELTDTLMRY